MTSILCLFVVKWVVIYVMHDHHISSGQVDSHAASFSREQKHEYFTVFVVVVNKILSMLFWFNFRLEETYKLDLS